VRAKKSHPKKNTVSHSVDQILTARTSTRPSRPVKSRTVRINPTTFQTKCVRTNSKQVARQTIAPSIVASTHTYLCRRGPIPFHFLRVIRPTRRARRASHLPTTARHVSSSKDLLHHRHLRRRRRHRRRHHRRRYFPRRGSVFKTDGVSGDDACDRSRRSSEHARLSAVAPIGNETKQRVWREIHGNLKLYDS